MKPKHGEVKVREKQAEIAAAKATADLIGADVGNGIYNLPISYHLAHNELYRLVQKEVNINLSLKDTIEVTLALELPDLMNQVDYTENVPHMSESTPIANLLMNNLADAFYIQ